jgi:hypothetical protein
MHVRISIILIRQNIFFLKKGSSQAGMTAELTVKQFIDTPPPIIRNH